MNRFSVVCTLIGLSQLVLGALYLFAPQWFVAWQGLSAIGADIGYPLAMLAARFLVYGVGMIVIARNPGRYGIWLDGMIAGPDTSLAKPWIRTRSRPPRAASSSVALSASIHWIAWKFAIG